MPGHKRKIIQKLFKCEVCKANAEVKYKKILSCDSCKSFYLRNRKNEHFVCVTGSTKKKCLITENNRHLCPCCRFRKCVKVGFGRPFIVKGHFVCQRCHIECHNTEGQFTIQGTMCDKCEEALYKERY